jgi:DNA-directed RNA polymerase specialized sigma24 family protein
VPEQRPHHRPVPLPPDVVADVGDASLETTAEAELLERLESALRLLPAAERRAVLAAHASDDSGVAAVAETLGLSAEDAEALTRSAVQLLRGALTDVEPEPPPAYGSVERRRRISNRRAE